MSDGRPTRLHLRCPVCSAQRTFATYGISPTGEVVTTEPVSITMSVQYLGRGRKQMWWETGLTVPLPVAQALRERMRIALAQLDAEIAAALVANTTEG